MKMGIDETWMKFELNEAIFDDTSRIFDENDRTKVKELKWFGQ
jgi:hypothetical protein